MQPKAIWDFVDGFWDDEVVASLKRYIEIPNKSPMFDPDWQSHGFMNEAFQHVIEWVERQQIPNLIVERHQLEGRTPLLSLEFPGTGDDTVLVYGHLDKQPEFSGWEPGLGPWKPVLKENRLYGRGGADDGYAVYSAVTAIRSLQDQGLSLPRIVVLIEGSEESGSPDLPWYMETMTSKVGLPGLVIALDSSCGNYNQFWLTTSLRGMVIGDLDVRVLDEGAHSGAAGGIVASSFRILRQLLSRLEDETTGKILPSFLNEQIPEQRRQDAHAAAQVLKDEFGSMYSFAGNGRPLSEDPVELILSNTWSASLEVTGIDGLPDPRSAGNVLRPHTSARLALRLPPTTDAATAAEKLKHLLTRDPPNGASITFAMQHPNPGWHAPLMAEHLNTSVNEASEAFFGAPAMAMGCGGSIPFMEFLAGKFPNAQFVVTGVLGPHSNAHGPNEFLHLPTAKKVTACVAKLIHDWGTNT